MSDSFQGDPCHSDRAGEKGWALLGLLLALTIMSIVMASAITPNVTGQVQRSKEEDLLYRGDRIAKAIARYYNNGQLNPLNPLAMPRPLTELKKLRDGVTIGVREVKFIRPSEMIDPMSGLEWEPVRLRDPRLQKVFEAWSSKNAIDIPPLYKLMASAQKKSLLGDSSGDGDQQTPGGGGKSSRGGSTDPQDPDAVDPEISDTDDPLSHIPGLGLSEGPGHSNSPIIGVVPRVKGATMHDLYGLERYEEWVFIYIPINPNRPGSLIIPPGGNSNSGGTRTRP
jgi:type II secretory pathway pseudopilin PulG